MKFERCIDGICIRSTEFVHLNRVVNHQLRRLQGIDFFRAPPSCFMASRIAARSTMAGTPVKSCIKTRAGMNAISRAGSALGLPFCQKFDVVGGNALAVFLTEKVFQQYPQAVRKTAESEAFGLKRIKTEDFILRFPTFKVDWLPKLFMIISFLMWRVN